MGLASVCDYTCWLCFQADWRQRRRGRGFEVGLALAMWVKLKSLCGRLTTTKTDGVIGVSVREQSSESDISFGWTVAFLMWLVLVLIWNCCFFITEYLLLSFLPPSLPLSPFSFPSSLPPSYFPAPSLLPFLLLPTFYSLPPSSSFPPSLPPPPYLLPSLPLSGSPVWSRWPGRLLFT